MEQNDNNNPNEGAENPAPIEQGDDSRTVQNVHAEFSRKYGQMEQTLAQQASVLQEIAAKLAQAQPAAPQAPQKALKDLVYDDPDQAAEIITQRAIAEADRRVDQRIQLNQATSFVVSDMQAKYSEFAQAGSDAAKLAVAKANALPAHLKGTPEGLKLAMMEVVADLGLVPASKRQAPAQQSNEDFQLGNRGNSAPRQRQPDPKKEIDPLTIAFAEAMGVDVNDPKRIEGLKQASKRTNYNRYG